MGTFTHPIHIGSLAGGEFAEVEALVDTGTTYTSLPASVLNRLGVEQEGYRRFELADNRIVEYPIGYVRVQVNGNDAIVLVVFTPEDTSPLLGATTLENLSLGVGPVSQRLVPVPALMK